MERFIDTIIVGGGLAGLSLSYYLNRRGREYIVLERALKPVEAWQSYDPGRKGTPYSNQNKTLVQEEEA